MKHNNLQNYIIAPITVIAFFSVVSIISWLAGDNFMSIINYIYIGLFASLGMLLFAKLSPKKKLRGRKISMFAIGGLLFLAMGVMGRIDGQIEGFFFYGLAGITAGTVMHYLIAKIIGPLFINRGWCGWGCWSMMIFDLFPYKRSDGRLPAKFGWIRYLHFALSLSMVLLLWYGFQYSISREKWDIAGMYWFLGGNAFYYALGISMILWLKDNRAFCKYICPVTVILKASSSFSILRIKGNKELCKECDACVKTCPMNIRISDYVQAGIRVLSSECTMCLSCISTCSSGSLRASLGFDVAGKSQLVVKGE